MFAFQYNLVHVLAQMMFMDYFLNHEFRDYGLKALAFSEADSGKRTGEQSKRSSDNQ